MEGRADIVPLAFADSGSGSPAVLLVHGWACDRSYWNGQLEALSARGRVIAVDLAGHGESPPARARVSIEGLGADVAALVARLGLDRVILVGHSMGGDVVVEAARRLPGRVAAIVWVDAYRALPPQRDEAQIDRLLAPFRVDFAATMRAFVRGMFGPGADPALVEHVVADMAAADPEAATALLEASLRYGRDVVAALAELALPVIAINPDDPPTDADSLERHGIRLVPMHGVGHFLMMEDAPRFNALLADQLAAVGGR